MKALLLAAGLGTRLRPLTEHRAKPSLPVLGIPMLWYSAWHLKKELGIDSFAMNMCHAADSLKRAGDDSELSQFTGINFHYSDEIKQVQGSSGCLKKLSNWIGNDLLAVSNADSVFFPSWKQMVEFHELKKATSKEPILTLHLRPFKAVSSDEHYSSFDVDPLTGRVLSLTLKATHGLMFSGAYLFEPGLLQRLPDGVSELRTTLLDPLIKEGKLFAFCEELPWFDVGKVSSYIATQFQLLNQLPQARELIEVKMSEVAKDCWVPKSWKTDGLSLKSPVVMTGMLSQWFACAHQFGPKFIGIEPPANKETIPTQDVAVFENHQIRF